MCADSGGSANETPLLHVCTTCLHPCVSSYQIKQTDPCHETYNLIGKGSQREEQGEDTVLRKRWSLCPFLDVRAGRRNLCLLLSPSPIAAGQAMNSWYTSSFYSQDWPMKVVKLFSSFIERETPLEGCYIWIEEPLSLSSRTSQTDNSSLLPLQASGWSPVSSLGLDKINLTSLTSALASMQFGGDIGLLVFFGLSFFLFFLN